MGTDAIRCSCQPTTKGDRKRAAFPSLKNEGQTLAPAVEGALSSADGGNASCCSAKGVGRARRERTREVAAYFIFWIGK